MLKFLHFASGLENYYINPYRRLFFLLYDDYFLDSL